jgi:hypothetical protein
MPDGRVPFDPAELLLAVPTANRAVRVEPQGQGMVLWVPVRQRWWMGPPLGWFLPFRKERGVALDAIGRQVYVACDGVHTTEQIIEQFAERHRLRFHEARLSVLAFLRSLVERNLIVLVTAEGPEA